MLTFTKKWLEKKRKRLRICESGEEIKRVGLFEGVERVLFIMGLAILWGQICGILFPPLRIFVEISFNIIIIEVCRSSWLINYDNWEVGYI